MSVTVYSGAKAFVGSWKLYHSLLQILVLQALSFTHKRQRISPQWKSWQETQQMETVNAFGDE